MITEVKEKRRTLAAFEQETIINFNREEKTAYIFTYEKTWQRHLEIKLGLKPVSDNGFGGRDYEITKDRIPMPRARKIFTPEHKRKLVNGLRKARQIKQGTLL